MFCVQPVSDTFVLLNITSTVYFFYNSKSWHLDFQCIFSMCQLSPPAGHVGTHAEVREKDLPSFFLRIASNLCGLYCGPTVLLPIAYLLIYLLSYLLTPCRRVFLEKLTGSQLVKKFPAFYATRRFITTFTSARQLSLSWSELPIRAVTVKIRSRRICEQL